MENWEKCFYAIWKPVFEKEVLIRRFQNSARFSTTIDQKLNSACEHASMISENVDAARKLSSSESHRLFSLHAIADEHASMISEGCAKKLGLYCLLIKAWNFILHNSTLWCCVLQMRENYFNPLHAIADERASMISENVDATRKLPNSESHRLFGASENS